MPSEAVQGALLTKKHASTHGLLRAVVTAATLPFQDVRTKFARTVVEVVVVVVGGIVDVVVVGVVVVGVVVAVVLGIVDVEIIAVEFQAIKALAE